MISQSHFQYQKQYGIYTAQNCATSNNHLDAPLSFDSKFVEVIIWRGLNNENN